MLNLQGINTRRHINELKITNTVRVHSCVTFNKCHGNIVQSGLIDRRFNGTCYFGLAE